MAEKEELGATGEFPDGKLNENDEGELKMAIGVSQEEGVVILDFGKLIKWIGIPKEMALGLAKSLVENANKLPD